MKELEKREGIESKICVTAQHREMLDQVLELFDIKPDFDLNIMKTKQSLTGITNRILEGLETIFKEEKPDMILVHGDTTTTFSSALAAYYQQIKVRFILSLAASSLNTTLPFSSWVNSSKRSFSVYFCRYPSSVPKSSGIAKVGIIGA